MTVECPVCYARFDVLDADVYGDPPEDEAEWLSIEARERDYETEEGAE